MTMCIASYSNPRTIHDGLNLTLIFCLIHTEPSHPENLSLVVTQDAQCKNNTKNVTIKWMVSVWVWFDWVVASFNYAMQRVFVNLADNFTRYLLCWAEDIVDPNHLGFKCVSRSKEHLLPLQTGHSCIMHALHTLGTHQKVHPKSISVPDCWSANMQLYVTTIYWQH